MSTIPPLSVLDLSPIPEGADAGQALRNSADLARHVEALGYRRYWMAEHHNMPGIASAATAVALAHVASGLAGRIRIGAGGIMLPNHAPLVIAEQFGTLAALHPGRVDLGLGRAPGTDRVAMHALRRALMNEDDFPRDVMELMEYFRPAEPGQPLQAVPGGGEQVEVWILGSSTYGAQLAAMLGLPFAFASHFAPDMLMEAIAIYRERFRPSERLARPHAMLGYGVFAAETEEEARLLFTSQQQSFVNLRSGRPGKLPPPSPGYPERLDPRWRAALDHSLSCAAVGGPEAVRQGLADFAARTGADELMVTSSIHDHEARKRSYAITAEVAQTTGAPAAAA
jgi:luciferase family oxidoreductase group 1